MTLRYLHHNIHQMLKRTSQNSSTNGTKRIRPSDSAVKDANNGRKPYTLDEKAKFLALYNQEKERNPFVSLGAIAKMEGIHPNTALKMVQNEAQILHAVDTLPGQATKVVARQRKREMQAVEDALFKWYQKQQQYGKANFYSIIISSIKPSHKSLNPS